jgi:hypothetical protein
MMLLATLGWVTPIVIQLLSLIPTTIAAIAALIVSLHNSSKIAEIHVSLNSRLSELLVSTTIAARAEGRQQERDANANANIPPAIT